MTISAEEQQAAEQILRVELARQDAKVLEEARAALSALGWGQPAGGGGSKRPRRGQPEGKNFICELCAPRLFIGCTVLCTNVGKSHFPFMFVFVLVEPVGGGEILHPLPTTIDELCYELRLDVSRFTINEFKARLVARGLPVSGTRDALEARFLLAGAEFAPIKDFAEYTRLAKSRRFQLKHVIPTRAGDLIDTLLARCNK